MDENLIEKQRINTIEKEGTYFDLVSSHVPVKEYTFLIEGKKHVSMAYEEVIEEVQVSEDEVVGRYKSVVESRNKVIIDTREQTVINHASADRIDENNKAEEILDNEINYYENLLPQDRHVKDEDVEDPLTIAGEDNEEEDNE